MATQMSKSQLIEKIAQGHQRHLPHGMRIRVPRFELVEFLRQDGAVTFEP